MATRIDADFTDVQVLGDGLLPILNAARDQAPILWSDSLHGWVVTRHQDVADGFNLVVPLSNDRFPSNYFDSIPPAEQAARIPLTLTAQNWIVGVDPPQHTRIRSLALKAFNRRVVEDIRPYTRSVIDRVLTEAGERDEVNFVEDVAVAITGRTMARLLGIPEEHVEDLRRWSWDMNVGLGPVRNAAIIEQMEKSLHEMRAILEEQVEERRRAPREDFLSQLVTARDSGQGLTDEELYGLCFVTLSAGHDTTAHSMTLGFQALCRHPDQRDWLLAHPEKLNSSLSEIMRYIAMATAQPRVAAESFEWHGQRIEKGDFVYLMIAGANRDPSVFADPERLDLSRPSDKAMMFGGGIHHCIGHLLARMQLGEFFPESFRRFPNPQILEDRPEWQPSLAFRGLERLRVRMKP